MNQKSFHAVFRYEVMNLTGSENMGAKKYEKGTDENQGKIFKRAAGNDRDPFIATGIGYLFRVS